MYNIVAIETIEALIENDKTRSELINVFGIVSKILTESPNNPVDALLNYSDSLENLLLLAAEKGFVGTVSKLLQLAGVNVNCKDPDGLTPMVHAAENGHLEVVKLLLNIGARMDGEDAIYGAIRYRRENVVKFLYSEYKERESPNLPLVVYVMANRGYGHLLSRNC